jgi:hypothetical protein
VCARVRVCACARVRVCACARVRVCVCVLQGGIPFIPMAVMFIAEHGFGGRWWDYLPGAPLSGNFTSYITLPCEGMPERGSGAPIDLACLNEIPPCNISSPRPSPPPTPPPPPPFPPWDQSGDTGWLLLVAAIWTTVTIGVKVLRALLFCCVGAVTTGLQEQLASANARCAKLNEVEKELKGLRDCEHRHMRPSSHARLGPCAHLQRVRRVRRSRWRDACDACVMRALHVASPFFFPCSCLALTTDLRDPAVLALTDYKYYNNGQDYDAQAMAGLYDDVAEYDQVHDGSTGGDDVYDADHGSNGHAGSPNSAVTSYY